MEALNLVLEITWAKPVTLVKPWVGVKLTSWFCRPIPEDRINKKTDDRKNDPNVSKLIADSVLRKNLIQFYMFGFNVLVEKVGFSWV